MYYIGRKVLLLFPQERLWIPRLIETGAEWGRPPKDLGIKEPPPGACFQFGKAIHLGKKLFMD